MKVATAKVLCLGLVLECADIARANAVFHLWFETPSEVQAGSTFTLSAWAEVSGSILSESDGGFNSFAMDLVAGGLPVSIDAATMQYFVPVSAGTPASNALQDIVGVNHHAIPPFYTLNPIQLFTTEVTLLDPTQGEVSLAVYPTDGVDFILAWWLDYGSNTYVTDADLGSSLIVTPAAVRVVPAPATFALLALAGIGPRRRRCARNRPGVVPEDGQISGVPRMPRPN
ncbi:MAG: hypothetical protein DYG94_13110 [Leptolyngbya sp. PLA3]|nr:MAG: hypothetical protein EDM82_13605 [Cyanobacteria bacterium CYA]MCE7969665.1 hypothetical protein [Leptolyngbya sp. PL-A3]